MKILLLVFEGFENERVLEVDTINKLFFLLYYLVLES